MPSTAALPGAVYEGTAPRPPLGRVPCIEGQGGAGATALRARAATEPTTRPPSDGTTIG